MRGKIISPGVLRTITRFSITLFASFTCAGCQTLAEDTVEWSPAPLARVKEVPRNPAPSDAETALDIHSPSPATSRSIGSGLLIGPSDKRKPQTLQNDGQGITLNMVNASISQAAKTILGDILQLNYEVSSAIEGHITIQTSIPVPKSTLIDLFQNALKSNGSIITNTGDLYKVEGMDQAARGPVPVTVGAGPGTAQDVGLGTRVVQLKFVSAVEMRRILDPIVPKGSIMPSGDSRNALILNGTPSEISTILDTIAIFDVDVMRGMSVALVPITTAQPEAIVNDLRSVFGSDREGPMSGMVRFLPNQRLKSILVMSPQRIYLDRAEAIIRRLDSKAQGIERHTYIYKALNRPAKELAEIIDALFSKEDKNYSKDSGNVAPRLQETSIQAVPASPFPGSSPFGSLVKASSVDRVSASSANNDQAAATASVSTGASVPTMGGTGDDERLNVITDAANNSLVIMASAQEYKKVIQILRELDVTPNQVMIEATIAEVSLNDDLKFGVRWYFQHKNMGAGLTDSANDAVSSVFPGFTYALAAKNVSATFDALNTITRTNIVSSPSLTVLDGKTATLQIGDQVPVVTQSASSVLSAGAPLVNSVNYRDTGVILSITPHISESGRVLLDIEQEVSSVGGTTTSNIDSPTIKQRKIKTTVLVMDGETLALGGLIQDSLSNGKSQIPIMGDIPIIGNAFGQKANSLSKTELIVLITPKVAKDLNTAQEITNEYRRKFEISMSHTRGARRSIANTTMRLLK